MFLWSEMRIFELLNTLSTSDDMSGIGCMHKAICANWCQHGEFKCCFQSCMRSVTTSSVAIWNHWNWLLPPLTISIQALFFLRQIGTVSTEGPDGILEIFPAWGVKLISSEWHIAPNMNSIISLQSYPMRVFEPLIFEQLQFHIWEKSNCSMHGW